MTQDERDRLRVLLANVTAVHPAPWSDGGVDNFNDARYEPERVVEDGNGYGFLFLPCSGLTHAAALKDDETASLTRLLAAAVNALPALLDALDAAEARVAELTAAPGRYRCGCPVVRSDLVKAFCPTHLKKTDDDLTHGRLCPACGGCGHVQDGALRIVCPTCNRKGTLPLETPDDAA